MPFVPNAVQESYLDQICPRWRDGDTRINGERELILKSRQFGFSTLILALLFLDTINTPNTQTVVIAHDLASTARLFQIVQRFYRFLPDALRPATRYANRHEFLWPDLDSSFFVGTAGNGDFGRGGTINNIHACLGPDTLVIGSDGFVFPITNPPTLVRDGQGKLIRVCDVAVTNHEGETALRITTGGNAPFPLTVTPDHRFLCRQDKSGTPVWKRADELTRFDYVAFPLTEPRFGKTQKLHVPLIRNCVRKADSIVLNRDFGLLVGWYLAEGSVMRNSNNLSGLTLSCDRDEADELEQLARQFAPFLTSIRRTDTTTSRTTHIVLYGRQFAQFLVERFGHKDEKRIPDAVWNYPRPFVEGLLTGLLEGDGCFTNIRNVSYCSVRPQLVVQVKRLAIALRIGYPDIQVTPAGVRHGRNEREQWVLRFCGPANTKLRRLLDKPRPPRSNSFQAFIDRRPGTRATQWSYGHHSWRRGRDHYWARVRKIEAVPAPPLMYDLCLAEDPHSYCTLAGVVHNSEIAFWPNAEELIAGLMQTVPPDGNVFQESTANGVGNYFFDEYERASAGDSAMQARFFPWFAHADYSSPAVPPDFAPDEDEARLKSLYGLTDAQLFWRRTKRREPGMRRKFVQEFPANPREAFVSSGNPYFDLEKLDALAHELKSPLFDPLPAQVPLDFPNLRRERASLLLWELPQEGRVYVIGADTAEGITTHGDHDYDSASVWDALSGLQVAHLHGRWDTHLYGLLLAELGRWYNLALLCIERNNHGHAVINSVLYSANYPEARSESSTGLYLHQEYDERRQPRDRRAGFPTTATSKTLILDELASAVESGDFHPRSRALVSDMMRFIKLPGGKAGGEGKTHDDRVLDAALARRMLNLRPRQQTPFFFNVR